MIYVANIYVTLKSTVNDPQGNTIVQALKSLGFSGIQDVRMGKYLTIRLEASNVTEATTSVDGMCNRLLANPVIETYRFDLDVAQ